MLLSQQEDSMIHNVFYNLRLPRTLVVIVSGFTLAFIGSILQTIFKNPIAAPEIIGVSSGASAGAAIAILGFSGGFYITMTSAFVGAILAATFAFILASYSKQQRLASFVLAGVAINAVAQAIIMLCKLVADPLQKLAAIEFWMMGGFSNITSKQLLLILPIEIIAIGILFILRRQIILLSLSDEEAQSLGVHVKIVRPFILILCAFSVAGIVSVTGLISFIGLVAPHFARILTKRNTATVWLISAILGATLLLVADMFARSLLPSEIPISILTSFIGAPTLIYLMMRKEKLS